MVVIVAHIRGFNYYVKWMTTANKIAYAKFEGVKQNAQLFDLHEAEDIFDHLDNRPWPLSIEEA